MSSAILYVAIVAIWACVLIPRWLRRDSPVAASDSGPGSADDAGGEAAADPAAEEQPSPLSSVPPVPPVPRPGRVDPPRERRTRSDEDRDERDDPAYRRVVSARRRLLLMLAGLAIGSGVLAGTKLAAWWVVVPPSVMLLAYLLLLRAAGKADAERRERARIQRAAAARAPVRPPAAVPHAQVITIPAAPEPAEEDIYDQYADAKLRAVGD